MSDNNLFQNSPWGYHSPWSFAPIAIEFCAASLIYLCLIDKGTAKGNFPMLIMYSVLKLLAIAAVFTSNLTLFGVPNLPFLFGLLVNETVLLVLGIQIRSSLQGVVIRKLYPKGFLLMRNVSELLSVFVLAGVAFVSPLLLSCPCPIVFSKALVHSPVCKWRPRTDHVGKILRPQLQGISFAISILAGTVSVGGVMEIFGSAVRYAIRESPGPRRAPVPMVDPGWKKVVRTVFCWLGFVIVGLFAVAYFTPGVAICTPHDCMLRAAKDSGGKGTFVLCKRVTYTLGPVSSTLINAMVAISQMFVFDMLQRVRERESITLDLKLETSNCGSREV